MPRLSKPLDALGPHYDVLVVGSGYGGSIFASRMSRAGRRVCLLERGEERWPGEYPDTQPEALAEVQVDSPEGRLGSRTGMFDFRVNPDINVLVGCGLGGTSLINANVSARATPEALAGWPPAVRDDPGLEVGFARAEAMLRPRTARGPFRKRSALEKSGIHLGVAASPVPVNVNFDTYDDGRNAQGATQPPCTSCGDCVTGCNVGAKNTVLMNYLPDAVAHGCEVFVTVSVQRVERHGTRWRAWWHRTGDDPFHAPPAFVDADVLVLAAGTLGSTEILLRSRDAGLSTSGRLGQRFSGNGDVLGFAYNCDERVEGVGAGPARGKHAPAPGPCITGIIDARPGRPRERQFIVEEGTIPGALAGAAPAAYAAASAVAGRDTDTGLVDLVAERTRELAGLVAGPRHGALPNTQVFLVMAQDDAAGALRLEDGRLRVSWPGVGSQPFMSDVSAALRDCTAALGGTWLPNPAWASFLRHPLVTVHPLGGCCLAEQAEDGVVDTEHRVFAGAEGTAVHEDLLVADGAVVPGALGINPLLTISALAERAAARLARRKGWVIDYDSARRWDPGAPGRRTGIRFTERMAGSVGGAGAGTFEGGAAAGQPFEFVVTIDIDDIDALEDDTARAWPMSGTVVAPGLREGALQVVDGQFCLFVPGPPGEGRMTYAFSAVAPDGRSWTVEGHKVIRDDPGLDAWADTTTLFVTVRDAEAIAGRGILRINPADFARQLTTLRATGPAEPAARLAAVARFGRRFARSLWDVYGGQAPW